MSEIRPAIIEDGKWSKYVKGVIRDLNNKIIGVVINKDEKLIIEFFDEISPIIIYDKKNKKFMITFESFPINPKEYFEKLRW